MDIYSLLSCWVFTISLPYFEAFRQASVCLIQQFCGLREDGGGVRGEPHVVFTYCLCVFMWETLQLLHLKIAPSLWLGLPLLLSLS